MKNILITGTSGFIGKNAAAYFKAKGFKVFGIGHGILTEKEIKNLGLHQYICSDINVQSLSEFNTDFNVILHLGGSGSVGFSVENPLADFYKSVIGTIEILEFMRTQSIKSKLIYPSSPAAQGSHPDEPINENFQKTPNSPYGNHKLIAEQLIENYSRNYELQCTIIRLFSVYGPGLKKQLIWDSYRKLTSENSEAIFWGTGKETRDFIHISNVLQIFHQTILKNERFLIVNGGTGVRTEIKEVISMIAKEIGCTKKIIFNSVNKPGDPIYFLSDQKKLNDLYNIKFVTLKEGIKSYVKWASKENN